MFGDVSFFAYVEYKCLRNASEAMNLAESSSTVVFQLLFSMYNSIETNKLFISIYATHGHSILSNQNQYSESTGKSAEWIRHQ
jgi:hypothetical protein